MFAMGSFFAAGCEVELPGSDLLHPWPHEKTTNPSVQIIAFLMHIQITLVLKSTGQRKKAAEQPPIHERGGDVSSPGS